MTVSEQDSPPIVRFIGRANIGGMQPVSEATVLVGRNVAALRKKAGWTQADLAAQCEMARPRIAEIESGKFNPTVDTLQEIADALEVDVSALFKRTLRSRIAS